MKIYIGTDHAGFELKETLKTYIQALGHEVVDQGAFEMNESDDYPDFVIPVAKAVSADAESLGIVLGGSGNGEAMCANRIAGVRCAVFYGGPISLVKLAREHNNANMLSFGARFVEQDEAEDAVRAFLETKFSGDERHSRRLAKF